MVGVPGELRPVLLICAEPVEPLDARAAVGSPQPLATRLPLELRSLRSVGECLAGLEQGLDVDAVIDGLRDLSHGVTPPLSRFRLRVMVAREPARESQRLHPAREVLRLLCSSPCSDAYAWFADPRDSTRVTRWLP